VMWQLCCVCGYGNGKEGTFELTWVGDAGDGHLSL
jgi:hypothetical protein